MSEPAEEHWCDPYSLENYYNTWIPNKTSGRFSFNTAPRLKLAMQPRHPQWQMILRPDGCCYREKSVCPASP